MLPRIGKSVYTCVSDSRVKSLTRFKAKSKTFELVIRELQKTQISFLIAKRHAIFREHALCSSIRIKKTKVMYNPSKATFVQGPMFEVVDTVIYLGNTLARDIYLDLEIFFLGNSVKEGFEPLHISDYN